MTIQDYLTNLCKHCGLAEEDFSVEVEEKDGAMRASITVPDEDSGLFIGYHGETLESVQRLIRISFRDEIVDKKFQLNVNQYREQRVGQLEERAKNVAERVLQTGEEYVFPYLSSYDRFVVHSTISEDKKFDKLETASQGEGKNRLLTVRLKG